MLDFTRAVITENDIRAVIRKIFVDAIILKAPYTIVSVGESLSALFGIPHGHLDGMPLSEFSKQMPSRDTLTGLLRPGFFDKYEVTLDSRTGMSVQCTLSGFYLGIIGDISDMIIVNIKPSRLITTQCHTVQIRQKDLDDFIYAASHDLRGPLATIKGLISLMNLPGEKDYDFFLEKMTYLADSLDDRLHKLIYFAESDKCGEFSEQLSLEDILYRLNLSKDDQYPGKRVRLIPIDPYPTTKLRESNLLLALFHSIRLFFIRNCDRSFELSIGAKETDTTLDFVLTVDNFLLTSAQRQNFEVINFGYTEVLSNPQFAEIYSAKKIILRLQGSMYLKTSDKQVTACISIPRT